MRLAHCSTGYNLSPPFGIAAFAFAFLRERERERERERTLLMLLYNFSSVYKHTHTEPKHTHTHTHTSVLTLLVSALSGLLQPPTPLASTRFIARFKFPIIKQEAAAAAKGKGKLTTYHCLVAAQHIIRDRLANSLPPPASAAASSHNKNNNKIGIFLQFAS